MAEGRLQNGDIFSFLRRFGGSLEALLDNSVPRKTKRRKFTVARVSNVKITEQTDEREFTTESLANENSVSARDFAKADDDV